LQDYLYGEKWKLLDKKQVEREDEAKILGATETDGTAFNEINGGVHTMKK